MIRPELIYKKYIAEMLLLDTYPNAAFAYSNHKLKSSATAAFRAYAPPEEDILFAENIADSTQLETLANGSLARGAKFFDQTGNARDLIKSTVSQMVHVTDVSGVDLGYLASTVQGEGFFTDVAPMVDLSGDYILSFVMRNETTVFSQRPSFYVKNGSDLIALQIARSGSSYQIDYAVDNYGGSVSDGGLIHTPANFTDWEIYTLRRIGGTVTLNINGTDKVWGATQKVTDTEANSDGIAISTRPKNQTLGRTCNFQTFIGYTGADLSGFDLTGFINEMKTLHGIS